MQNEIVAMHLHRATWLRVQAIIEHNGELPDSYWWRFMSDTYASSQAAAVRRQVYADRDAASLGRLITEIADDAGKLTREFWFSCWGTPDSLGEHVVREHSWRTHYAGSVGEHLDPAIPTADLADLRAASIKVTDYVDRHIAHSDRRPIPPTRLPTLADVHDAIDKIGFLFAGYTNLLDARVVGAFLEPVIQQRLGGALPRAMDEGLWPAEARTLTVEIAPCRVRQSGHVGSHESKKRSSRCASRDEAKTGSTRRRTSAPVGPRGRRHHHRRSS